MFNFFERDIRNHKKINIDVKNTIIILIIYITISVISFLIYPLIEKITYLNQLKEGFLFFLFIVQIEEFISQLYYFFKYSSPIDLSGNLIFTIIITGNILPLILIYKNKKLFPYIIISIYNYFRCIFLYLLINWYFIFFT
jgi:hypothetical protein